VISLRLAVIGGQPVEHGVAVDAVRGAGHVIVTDLATADAILRLPGDFTAYALAPLYGLPILTLSLLLKVSTPA